MLVSGIHGGSNQIGGSGNTQIVGVEPGQPAAYADADVQRLIEALALDATRASPRDARRARQAAAGLGRGLERRQTDTVARWVKNTTELVTGGAAMMDATRKVLDAIS